MILDVSWGSIAKTYGISLRQSHTTVRLVHRNKARKQTELCSETHWAPPNWNKKINTVIHNHIHSHRCSSKDIDEVQHPHRLVDDSELFV